MATQDDRFIGALWAAATEAVSHRLAMTLELKGGEVLAGVPAEVGVDYENVEDEFGTPPHMRTGRPESTLTIGGVSVLAEEVRAFTLRLPG